jgi:hypothetical protein
MVDGGLRLGDVSRANVDRVLAKHPRGKGFKHELARLIRAEARGVPDSRFALYARWGNASADSGGAAAGHLTELLGRPISSRGAGPCSTVVLQLR